MSTNVKTVKDLGLDSNSIYGDDCRAEIYHEKAGWVPVVETRNKVVYYRDENENTRKANLNKISEVNVIDTNKNPVPIKKNEETVPNVEPLAMGLMTNTDYSGSEVEVEHEDKGWLTLVATANKVLYVRDCGEKRRMTLSKLFSVRGVESPEVEDEEVLTREDNTNTTEHDEFDFSDELFTEPGTVG